MKTEEKIKDSATSVYLRFGYHATTVTRIAAEAHVAKAAVHYYFRNKDILYQLVLKKVFNEVVFQANLNHNNIFFLLVELTNNKTYFWSCMNLLGPENWYELLEFEIIKQKNLHSCLEYLYELISQQKRDLQRLRSTILD